jgi:hypothetical protein
MIDRKNVTRMAGVVATATVTMSLLSTGVANADTFVPLPGGELVETLADGTVVSVRLTGESATISPSMGATPLHRNAWVSGSAQVEINGEDPATYGLVYPGYVVGCQVSLNGGGFGGDVQGAVVSDGAGGAVGTVGGSAGAELSLGPGQTQSFYLLDLEQPDDYGNEAHSVYNVISGGTGSVTWSDSTIGLTGCAGYAQARSFVNVRVETSTITTVVTLWGQPFSLG